MNTYFLTIRLSLQPETLERLLRVIRHRGFILKDLSMQAQSNKQTNVHLTLKSDREIAFLTRQISKLIDVFECEQSAQKHLVSL